MDTRRQLTEDDRDEISRRIAEQADGKAIASRIGRYPSLVAGERLTALRGSAPGHGQLAGVELHKRAPGRHWRCFDKRTCQLLSPPVTSSREPGDLRGRIRWRGICGRAGGGVSACRNDREGKVEPSRRGSPPW